ncbi:hypothetical protein [Moraxella phage Mcat4]|nr:hypothetical protein [Moraxella phage Mcat4]
MGCGRPITPNESKNNQKDQKPTAYIGRFFIEKNLTKQAKRACFFYSTNLK